MDNNEFDFNVSQNQEQFQGNQDIILEDSINDNNNGEDKNGKNSFGASSSTAQEKPQTSGANNRPSLISDNSNQININTTGGEESSNLSTLDEPIMTTLKRDLYAILTKIKYVAVPKMTERKLEELYNWDLWGPLIFCFLYSIALSTGDNTNNESSIFVLIFVIFWIGGFVITFNGRFLGAQIGICQMISLLGYAMFPITIGGLLIGFLRITNIWAKFFIVLIGFIWACLASVGFIGGLVQPERKFIAVFPVFLFLLSLSMFALNY